MSKRVPDNQPGHPDPGIFLTTRWSIVVMAGVSESEAARAALEDLCRGYWRPLYYFARRSGFGVEDAQDLTQEFLIDLVEKTSLAKVDRSRGRFRTFLLGAFSHRLANFRRDRAALKRGGGRQFVSMDTAILEGAFAAEACDTLTPELQYERSWAYALLEKVMERLEGEYGAAGRGALFEAIQPTLSGMGTRLGYAGIASALGLSESAVTVAVHRMRKRYGALLREEIAATVVTEEEVTDELQHLMRIFSGGGSRE